MSGEGPWITTILNYDGGDEAKLKINVEGVREEEMTGDLKLQVVVTKAKNRAKRRCRRDRFVIEVQVTITYHEAETSIGTTERGQQHLDRDRDVESEASDLDAETQSWHGLDQWQKDHPPAEPVESGPEAILRRRRDHGR
ncbi:hypothetical protein CBR_g721 [Chara braunii]|uniref:Uncharacterized protein n=1 Tax=Chara braunii TaxID=69332 RepID=A0A388KC00_CHABU|nr:hypothetical protein CBR_g721 [Chara braunii]|eukprot:GBG67592.1 hypothetical protein CBR_g721 [Chara braunii]